MQKSIKKLLAVVLSVLIVAMTMSVALAAPNTLTIRETSGGSAINALNVKSGNGWEYDSSTSTLTITDNIYSVVYGRGSLNIKLANGVIVDTLDNSAGIGGYGSTTVNITIEGSAISPIGSATINKLTPNSDTVTLKSGVLTVTDDFDFTNVGYLIIDEGATFINHTYIQIQEGEYITVNGTFVNAGEFRIIETRNRPSVRGTGTFINSSAGTITASDTDPDMTNRPVTSTDITNNESKLNTYFPIRNTGKYEQGEYVSTCTHPNDVVTAGFSPTCVVDGQLQYSACPDCKNYYYGVTNELLTDKDNDGDIDEADLKIAITISAPGHVFTATVPAAEATCLADGNHAYKQCEYCELYFADAEGIYSENGKETNVEFIISAPNAHDFTVFVSSTEGTCVAEATETYKCSRCDATDVVVGAFGTHKDENSDHICDYGCGVSQGTHADSAEDADHVCDYGCGVVLEECVDTDKDHDCDNGCDVYFGTCVDNDKDHYCDYGCGAYFGEHKDENSDHACDYGCKEGIGAHGDADKDHYCDYNCGEYYGEHADSDMDHACDYGCSVAIGTCEDADKDHDCDYGCDKYYGVCEDADKDHDCDYGCDVYFGEHADENKDHACDYGCKVAIGTCEDADKDHDCDYGCDEYYGICEDADTDHDCDYGCDKYYGICEDADTDHDCDYGCDKYYGVCEDADKDHDCDYGCDKVYGDHVDADLDHACDYGCKVAIGTCEDADKDHDCDYGCDVYFGEHADENKDHACDYGCKEGIGAHGDADKDHYCDYNCGEYYGEHADSDMDHACDYGCSVAIGTCEDTDKDHDCDYGCDKYYGVCEDDDKDHDCDYGCDKYFGAHADADKDHACDYGCTVTIGVHADATDDKDHVCDYGCGEVLEDHAAATDAAVAPTCTKTGLTEGSHCSICGEVLVAQNVVAALGHKYEGVVTAPTCTTKGYTTYTCSVCGDTYVADETAALGHTTVIDEAVEPTCTQTGLKEGSHCGVCGEILKAQKVIPTIEHSFTNYVYDEGSATCTSNGTKTAHCDFGCGTAKTKTASGTKLAHVDADGDGKCDICGSTSIGYCELCGGPQHEDFISHVFCILTAFFQLVASFIRSCF